MKKTVWMLPVVSAIFVISCLGAYYAYEIYNNRKVENLRDQAESLALAGKLSESKALVEQGLRLRPNHKTLQRDMDWVKQGEDIQKQMQEAKELVKQQQLQQASSLIDKAEAQVKDRVGLFYEKLAKQVASEKTAVTVAQIKNEMQDKQTVEELGPLLSKLADFHVPEAEEAASEIRKKISELAYGKANELIAKKQFTYAIAVIEQALQYDNSDEKLLSFKDTVEKQKSSFEQTEQQRIEEAMTVEAKENVKNQTRSVEVLDMKKWVTNAGDFHLSGVVRNVGSKPVSMIQILYDVYSENGKKLLSGSTYVYPNYLGRGETGQFENSHYGLWNGSRVEVTKITWYLDK